MFLHWQKHRDRIMNNFYKDDIVIIKGPIQKRKPIKKKKAKKKKTLRSRFVKKNIKRIKGGTRKYRKR